MPGGAPLVVANVGSLPTAIPTKQQPQQQQQRQSASASHLDDLSWATPSYQLNVVTAPPPDNHNQFTSAAGHESSSSTMGNDAQQQDAPFDQQRRGISNAGLLNANTGQVGGNGSNNNNIGVAQIQTLSMLLDQCDKFVASILHGGPNNATTPSVSPTPPLRSSVALSQQQQQQAFPSSRGNSLTIRGKIEGLQQQHRRASPLLMGVFRVHQHNHHYNRQQQQPLEMSDNSGGGGGIGASSQRLSMMTRSSSGTSAMSKRGHDSVGEDDVGDVVDHQVGDAVGATFPPRTSLERSPVSSTPQSLVPEASHPPLVDMHATCDSPQWGVDSILAFPSHTSSTKMPHLGGGGGGGASSNAPMLEVHHNRNNIINNSAHVEASSQQTATTTAATATQPQRAAFERNLSICSQFAALPQTEGASHIRQAPSLHTSPMTGALPTAITASKSLPPSLNSGFSASSLLEIQKHIQAAQMILHNEWIQNKNLVAVVDTATPIIRTPVGPSPSGGGGGAGGSSGTSFPRAIPQQSLEDDVSFSCMLPPALQLQQPHEQQIAATALVAFGPQNSDANSGIHKPLPSSSSIGRRGGSVSSGVDAVLMFAPTSSTAALPSWPLGGQSPAVNDDFHHHGGLSVASFVDDMLSSTTTTTVRAGGGGTNKSAASPSLVSSARDESRAPEVQSVRQAGLHLTTTTLTKSMDEFTGNKIVNQYLLLDDIGEGACGRVKLAYSLERNITVAVKVVPKSIGQKTSARLLGRRSTVKEDTLRHEISLMKRLRHPNLVSLFEVIDDPNAEKLYLVMRFADKGSVGAMREDLTCDAMPLRALVDMAFQVCCGLQYLHERGIYHRDIKPENILQTSDGQYMIGDFGISVVRRRRSTSSTSTALSSSTGILLDDRPLGIGTPLFMAPELLLAERSPVGEMFEEDNEPSERATYIAADMWALGVTLLALVFGKWPFESARAFRLCPDAVAAAAVAKFETIILRTPSCESHACYAARCAWKDVVAMLLSAEASKRPSASNVRKVSKALLLGTSLCANCGGCFLDGVDAASAKAASSATTSSSTSGEDDINNSTSYHLDRLQVTVGPEAVTRSIESGCGVDEQQHSSNKNGSNAEFCCSHRGPSVVSSPTIARAQPVDEDRSSSTGTGNDDPLSRNERENHRNANVRRSTIYDSWSSTRPQSELSVVEKIFSTASEEGEQHEFVVEDVLVEQRCPRETDMTFVTAPATRVVAGVVPLVAHPPTSPQKESDKQSPHRFHVRP